MSSVPNGTSQPTEHVAWSLAIWIQKQLLDVSEDDSIHECGNAAIDILENRPDAAKDLAYEKLHAFPFRDVPECWRRLYEEASIWIAVKHLESAKESTNGTKASGRTAAAVKRNNDGTVKSVISKAQGSPASWLTDIVKDLDMALILTGAPGRRSLIHDIFDKLECHLNQFDPASPKSTMAERFPRKKSSADLTYPVDQKTSISLLAFQQHLDYQGGPLVIQDIVNYWPATELWSNPQYLYRRTLHGQRLVPVELGRSYTDTDWSQKIMPFSEFLTDHLLRPDPDQIGYLAQHDLFDQVPALVQDTITPDLCYAEPPDTVPDNIPVKQPKVDQPIRNAWLGPAGTISPLHTDPYHNILCQVVGQKYVRLYSPQETPRLYPRGIDEAGVSLENTSHVDVSVARKLYPSAQRNGNADLVGPGQESNDELAAFEELYPLFKGARYLECVLEAGECLYIPVGWWHYVESLEVSFNVSYWFN